MARLRLGIVGCGAIAREAHLPVAANHPDFDVTALCDLDIAAARLVQREFGLRATITNTLGELAGKVDAVVVASPPAAHAPLTLQLFDMGIDVLCEKPLASSVADAVAMAEAARRTRRILGVALMTRFYPHNQVLKDVIEDGELGELEEVIAEDGAPLTWAMKTGSYYDRSRTAGGVLFDAGVHFLDRLLWLFGDLAEIDYEDDSFGGVETNARLRGSFHIARQRVPARLEFSWSHRLRRSIKIVGSHGIVEAAEPDRLVLHRKTRRGWTEMRIRCADSWAGWSPYHAQITDFAAAVRERRDPFVTADSAIGALALIERAYAQRRAMPQPWLERRGGEA